jgi:hypothetical protein
MGCYRIGRGQEHCNDCPQFMDDCDGDPEHIKGEE